jgi:hypothetical protein
LCWQSVPDTVSGVCYVLKTTTHTHIIIFTLKFLIKYIVFDKK